MEMMQKVVVMVLLITLSQNISVGQAAVVRKLASYKTFIFIKKKSAKETQILTFL